jgi:hypothetical protein
MRRALDDILPPSISRSSNDNDQKKAEVSVKEEREKQKIQRDPLSELHGPYDPRSRDCSLIAATSGPSDKPPRSGSVPGRWERGLHINDSEAYARTRSCK